MEMTLWVHPNPEGGYYSYSTHYSKGAQRVPGVVRKGVISYENHGSGEGITLQAVVETEGYGNLDVNLQRIYGRRNTDFFWKPSDDRRQEQAEKAFRKIRKVFGSKRGQFGPIVPGALYGEITHATWALRPGEIDVAKDIIRRAQA